jgi:hypothetical protein
MIRSHAMPREVSTLRLYLLRAMYLLNFVLLGASIWPRLIRHEDVSDPLQAVALSFWAALATLCALGIRYPLKMLPLLFIQLLYKSIWMTAVALPLWSSYRSSDYIGGMVLGIVLDLIAIPWPYVVAIYFRERAERWGSRPPVTSVASETSAGSESITAR